MRRDYSSHLSTVAIFVHSAIAGSRLQGVEPLKEVIFKVLMRIDSGIDYRNRHAGASCNSVSIRYLERKQVPLVLTDYIRVCWSAG
jgi:hypothetical protein